MLKANFQTQCEQAIREFFPEATYQTWHETARFRQGNAFGMIAFRVDEEGDGLHGRVFWSIDRDGSTGITCKAKNPRLAMKSAAKWLEARNAEVE
jgi:hypothetical protein